jgi:hypothetical protein
VPDDDVIPTRPPTFGEADGPPPLVDPEPTPAPAPAPTTGRGDIRKWVGAAIGVVAIAVAALVGTGIVSSDASTAGRGGPGGFRGGRGGAPFFPGGGAGQLPGGFGGGGPLAGNGTFAPQQQAPKAILS